MSETVARQRFEPWKDPSADAYVRILNVTKKFADFTAVDNVSLDIYKGEFFSLLGPSGCGKTTLLQMLAGFEQPSGGGILLEGEDLVAVPPYERPVNMMFQSYALFPHMTVENNIAFGLKQDKVPKPEIAKRVAEMIELVQLGPFANRKPHQLSGGQRGTVESGLGDGSGGLYLLHRLAVALGTMAALMLSRFGRFRGRTLFSGMIYAPLVMPEVITGLSLLLMFVAISFNRGFVTVTLAHITFSMCYVAVVVQSRLASFDRSIEEAAMDLGCPPGKTFFSITLPVIAPAIVSGWLLSFTLSLDDLVIASFTTGPGATTLPMKIYSQVRLGVTPEINAVSTILIDLVATGVLIALLLANRQEVRRQQDERLAANAP